MIGSRISDTTKKGSYPQRAPGRSWGSPYHDDLCHFRILSSFPSPSSCLQLLTPGSAREVYRYLYPHFWDNQRRFQPRCHCWSSISPKPSFRRCQTYTWSARHQQSTSETLMARLRGTGHIAGKQYNAQGDIAVEQHRGVRK